MIGLPLIFHSLCFVGQHCWLILSQKDFQKQIRNNYSYQMLKKSVKTVKLSIREGYINCLKLEEIVKGVGLVINKDRLHGDKD